MSLAAMLWALNDAPVDEPTRVLVLIALADSAQEDGGGAWPSVETLARRARCSERTVQYALRDLRRDGVIALQERATRHKPTVYRLNLALRRGADSAPLANPGVQLEVVRGATDCAAGVQPAAPEQSLNSPQPKTQAAQPPEDPIKAQAQEIIKAWWEWVPIKPAGKGAYWSSVEVVAALLKVGHAEGDIKRALARAGSPVTHARMEIALREATHQVRTSNAGAVQANLDWARRMEAGT